MEEFARQNNIENFARNKAFLESQVANMANGYYSSNIPQYIRDSFPEAVLKNILHGINERLSSYYSESYKNHIIEVIAIELEEVKQCMKLQKESPINNYCNDNIISNIPNNHVDNNIVENNENIPNSEGTGIDIDVDPNNKYNANSNFNNNMVIANDNNTYVTSITPLEMEALSKFYSIPIADDATVLPEMDFPFTKMVESESYLEPYNGYTAKKKRVFFLSDNLKLLYKRYELLRIIINTLDSDIPHIENEKDNSLIDLIQKKTCINDPELSKQLTEMHDLHDQVFKNPNLISSTNSDADEPINTKKRKRF